MDITYRLFHIFRLPLMGLLALGLNAHAQTAAGPSQVARFDLVEGSVQFQSAADSQTRLADTRWPLSTGDRVWTAVGSRAELDAGGTTVRLGDNTDMAFTGLDDHTTQLRVTAGTLGAVVRDVRPGERFEIDTPNLALVIDRPGRWRIDVDPGRNTTRVSAQQGSGSLYGENGQALQFAAPQSREFAFRTLAESAPLALRTGDPFDRWSDDRDRLIAQSPSLRYASADIPGVVQLDAYGDWGNDPRYGAIWYPRSVASNWSPYSNGHWEWIEPWGWTWIDDAPWGFAPFHYGRWQQTGSRWGWIPGPAQRRPAYTPALPFNGARPQFPNRPPGQVPMPRPMAPQRIGAPIEQLHDEVRRDQWQQNQNAAQAQHQADMQRQQQVREAQQRFAPSYEQNRVQDLQRQQIDRQQQQQRQQQEQVRQQQDQQQQLQAQQQARQQQLQVEQQQVQQRQAQAEQQQRQQVQQVQQVQPLQQQPAMQRQGGQQRPESAGPRPGGRPAEAAHREPPPAH